MLGRKRSKRRRAAETAGDALECGCCLGDLLVLSVVAGSVGLVRGRRRRARRSA